MIHLFKKKKSVLDIWSGTPEMHCHILPGIDDGAPDIETSLGLLEKYREMGCSRLIATPHTMTGVYNNTPESIKNAYKKIEGNVKGLEISYSSEYMLDDGFTELLECDTIIPLHKNYVLVEMSYFQPPENLAEQIFKIGTKGYIPILAHPERYNFYHSTYDIYRNLKQQGCLLQLNALSLTNHYGASTRKVGLKLLEDGLFDFIGVDTHKIEHLQKLELIHIPSKFEGALKRICDNTKAVFAT